MKGEPIEKRLKDILTSCNLWTSDSEPKNKLKVGRKSFMRQLRKFAF